MVSAPFVNFGHLVLYQISQGADNLYFVARRGKGHFTTPFVGGGAHHKVLPLFLSQPCNAHPFHHCRGTGPAQPGELGLYIRDA